MTKKNTDEFKLYSNIVKNVNDTKTEMRKDICEELKTNLTHLTAPQLKSDADEIQLIEKRKLNLIVSDLPENNRDVDDILEFITTCHDNVVPIRANEFITTERLEKPASNGNPRLLGIKLKSQETRKKLLTVHHHRNSVETKPVYIRPDLTKSQAEVDKKLREEWTVKGRDNFVIKNGKVVPRIGNATGNSQTSGVNRRALNNLQSIDNSGTTNQYLK